jgi:polysaccharide export outer membrane protein
MRAEQTMRFALQITLGIAMGVLVGCAGNPEVPVAPATPETEIEFYRIGPGDTLKFSVWNDPGLSETVTVRPDGRVSIPLVEDIDAAEKTPTELGREVERRLTQFVEEPLVTVIVTEFVGSFTQQVRVVGEATEPQAIPYRANMSLLDVMIEVGGLTEFAAGNRTTLVRWVDGKEMQYRVRVDDLIRDGDISANIQVRPGDILIIPESFF